MAANAKTIKRRIKSIANTKKITKAMELVAASKMRRAVNSVLATRPFAQLSWNTVRAVAKAVGEKFSHPLLSENKEAEKTLFVVFSSDRGLAGAFNANIARATLKAIKSVDGPVEVISVGRRGGMVMNREKIPVIASFEGLTNKPIFADTIPISNLVLEEYKKKTYKKVIVVYMDFVSAITQRPELVELLPLSSPEEFKNLGDAEEKKEDIKIVEAKEYTFEPNPQQVLDRVLPRLIETMIYQALLETAASEHSARMMAMRNASDAATDMLKDLTFTYNQIRQAGITQEIAEISSGAAAIEK